MEPCDLDDVCGELCGPFNFWKGKRTYPAESHGRNDEWRKMKMSELTDQTGSFLPPFTWNP